MLAQIGISTNAGGSSGINRSQLRGYLELDPRALDAALDNNLQAVRQLFGADTTGDMIIDSGVAFHLDAIARPYVETGGIISLKTGTIDSTIRQDQRRIDTMDRQLAAKEAELRIQFGRMEGAFMRMEQMQSSFDNFNRQNSNNR
jgi:flagellar hook-associated protein 2